MGLFSKKPKPRNPVAVAKDLLHESRNGNLATVKSLVEEARGVVPSREEFAAELVSKGLSSEEILRTVAKTGLRSPALAEMLAVGLFEAASQGHTEVVEYLTVQGANVDRKHPENGDTALGMAAFKGYDNIVQFLAWRAANVNTANAEGATPLMLAAGKCSAETVQKLLDRGADVFAVAKGGLMAKDFASFAMREDILEILDAAAQTGVNTDGKEVGLNAPAASGGNCIETYEIGGLTATTFANVESIGPIKYLYVLQLTAPGESSPILYITAEVSTLINDLKKISGSEVLEELDELPGGVVLGLFDSDGHHNLGVRKGLDETIQFCLIAKHLLTKMMEKP